MKIHIMIQEAGLFIQKELREFRVNTRSNSNLEAMKIGVTMKRGFQDLIKGECRKNEARGR
jgi:hypothetical protein